MPSRNATMQRAHQGAAGAAGRFGQAADHLLGMGRVERRQRLVDQPQLGIGDQRPGQPDALAFAAGQAIDALPQLVAEVECGQRRLGGRGFARVPQRAQAGDQRLRRQAARQHRGDDPLPWWQRRHLGREEQASAQPLPFSRRQRPRCRAEQAQRAGTRRHRAGQRLQQAGFAGARRTDQRELFTAPDVQRQPAQHLGDGQRRRRRAQIAQRDDRIGGRIRCHTGDRGRVGSHFSRPAFSAAARMPV
jgi:hypothetical protein